MTITLTVGQAPAITPVASTTFTVEVTRTFTVTAAGSPGGATLTCPETGTLPAG